MENRNTLPYIESLFTMKDVTALLGVTPQTIRRYEKINKSGRYDANESGYRQFPFYGITELFSLRELTKSGISIKTASDAITSGDKESYIDLFRQCISSLDEQREWISLVHEIVAQRLEAISSLPTNPSNLVAQRTTSPAFWLLDCEDEDGKVAHDEQDRVTIQQWTDLIPLVSYSPVIKLSELGVACKPHYHLGISEKYAHLAETQNNRAHYVPARDCVGCFMYAPIDGFSADGATYYSCLQPVLAYIYDQGLELVGDIISQLIVSNVTLNYSTDAEESIYGHGDYYYMWVPVSKINK